MPSQHKTTPLGTRLPEAERQAVTEAAAREGIAVNEWLRRAIRERLSPSPCHCLCGVTHKDQPGICTGDAQTVISRWATTETSTGIPVCDPCSAAIVSAAGR